MSDNSEFTVGEQVIVEDAGFFYLAKVRFGFVFDLKVIDVKDNEYKIHYNGWSTRFDKWVKNDDLNKDTELNRALMKFNNGHEKREDKIGKSLQIDLFTEMVFASPRIHSIEYIFRFSKQISVSHPTP